MDKPTYVFLNGGYVPRSEASLDIEDRGTMFADGVYEVVRYFNGKAVAIAEHLGRLKHSLDEIRLVLEPNVRFDQISDELVKRNEHSNCLAYWQVTRGSALRNHDIPAVIKPTTLAITYPTEPLRDDAPVLTLRAVLMEDLRWARCSIKSLMLLPNVLAKHEAQLAGADEAIMHKEGLVSEATAASVMMVRGGELYTPPADDRILPSITRSILLKLARALPVRVHETAVSVEELKKADEIFTCSTSKPVSAVVSLDQKPVKDGRAGPVTMQLHRAMIGYIKRCCF